ncbi:MAG: thioredoxin [Prevotella sp.]|nr:thioredoxin [Prevotella sp.]
MNTLKSVLLLAALASIALTSCSAQQKEKVKKSNPVANVNKKENKNMKVVELTKEEFKKKVMDYEANPQQWKFEGDKPAIIDFYATWCGPCKQTAPVVEALANEYDGKIDVYKVDVDQQEELAGLFGIQSIPTILFIPKDGQPQKVVGAMGKGQFEEIIQKVLIK